MGSAREIKGIGLTQSVRTVSKCLCNVKCNINGVKENDAGVENCQSVSINYKLKTCTLSIFLILLLQ